MLNAIIKPVILGDLDHRLFAGRAAIRAASQIDGAPTAGETVTVNLVYDDGTTVHFDEVEHVVQPDNVFANAIVTDLAAKIRRLRDNEAFRERLATSSLALLPTPEDMVDRLDEIYEQSRDPGEARDATA